MLTIKTDVLIIGGGGAGCRAAIEAADCGAQVLLVNKGTAGQSGATAFPVAEMAGFNFGDTTRKGEVESHIRDIVDAGQGMADEKLAALLACGAPKSASELEKWGVKFETDGDGYYIFKSCFSNTPRTHVIKGHGEPIIHAEMRQILTRPSVRIINDLAITELCLSDGACIGACGVTCSGEAAVISSGAVIMATGGSGQAFAKNMNPSDITGDGYAMAYAAGAELVNMEFMQIGIGFSWPIVNIFNGYLWEGLPGVSGRNGMDIFTTVLPEGISSDDVMHEHRRHFPFSTSDNSKFLEIAVQRAINLGYASAHGGIRVNFSHMTEEYVRSLKDDCGIGHMWALARDYMLSKNVDLVQDEMEISCFAHAINGGIKIDENASSSVDGLFAAGECAGGPHGADRLGGNMMVACQVFGRIAGERAAAYALKHKRENVATVLSEKTDYITAKRLNLGPMLNSLRREAQRCLLVDRTAEGLTTFLTFAANMEREIMAAPAADERTAANMSICNMLLTTKLMAKSALARRESRGAHHRADCPGKDACFGRPQIIRQKS